ncbi:MAG: hypothetical protein JNM95_09780 [Chitinophagaceae bacterium]|nr:hypothetical protein [Chitinophagaceae bacterium]
MKRLLLCLLILPLWGNAQLSFQDINGKWQETKRYKNKKKEKGFTDTMRVEIKEGFVLIRYDRGATLIHHEVIIEGNKLKFEKGSVEVVDHSRNKLVLHDKAGTHHFEKTKEFDNAPVPRIIPGREEGEKNVKLQTLQGKWTAYKKTDPEFTTAKFYLKSIQFTEDKGNGTYAAQVTFNNTDSVYTTDAFVYVKGTDFIISSDAETFKAKVLKSDGEELILEHGSITYFMKQFGKK